jgi:hypothetical protein
MAFCFAAGPLGAAAAQQHPTIAQATQATVAVTGRVTSTSGGGISAATVTAEGGGTRVTTRTAADGTYALSVPPGLYTISVTKGGYQQGSTDVTVLAGSPVTANVGLSEASLSNLQVIGRTASGGGTNNQARFNVSSSSDSQINRAVIENRITPDLTPLVNEIPGIDVYHSATNVNENFIVRGLSYETKTTLEGHPVSSGTGGVFYTQYTASGLFGGVDVLKGAGIGSPTAGQSDVGTVNIRTVDFTAKNSGFFQVGADQYGGTLYTGLIDVNLGKKFSLIAGESFSGYRGPDYGEFEPAVDISTGGIVYGNNLAAPNLTHNTVEFDDDMSNTYSLNAELIKARWRFSDATSLTGEFLGLQGRFDPQGGAYSQLIGNETIPGCVNRTGTTYAASATCTTTSVNNGGTLTTSLFNTPSFYSTPVAGGTPFYANTGLSSVGQNIPLYTFYPGSDVRQSQPNFNLDFRTTLKNDTILFRPYAAGIRRLIDGSNEADTPGNSGSWYAVTSNANCTAAFAAPSVANGGNASGPCFVPGTPAQSEGAYITNPGNQTYATVNALPNGYVCSAATPCLTTATGVNNSDQIGYSSPYTTLEVDKLFGYTFSYIHPVGANIYNLSVDHYYDDAQSFVNDASPLAPNCQFTVGGGPLVAPQPGCIFDANGGTATRPSPIGTPETFSAITDISLTGQFQLSPKLEFDFGNYFTHYVINAQRLNPTVVSLFTSLPGIGTSSIPVGTFTYQGTTYNSLIGDQLTASHYDPHFGLSYRPERNLNIRFTGGSSISEPYANQVSGFNKVNKSATSTAVTTPNNFLLPEEIIALDLGADYRLHDGTVVSADIYNDDVKNAWYGTTVPYTGPPIPGVTGTAAGATITNNQTFNVANEFAQGVEVQVTNEPQMGLGYRVSTSFKRDYYLGIPASFFAVPQYNYNGEQEVGIPYFKGYGELQYADPHGELIRLGMDLEGSNNEYNTPEFVTFDLGIRVPLTKGIMLAVTGENIFNNTMGSDLARAVDGQGVQPVAASIVNGKFVYSIKTPYLGLVNPGFQTFRLTLTKKL